MRLLGLFPLLVAISASPLLAQDRAPAASLQARGLVRAVQEATLASEMPARIVQLPLRDGDAFQRGDLLVEFDCDRPKAEWKTAEAERIGMAAAYDNSRRPPQAVPHLRAFRWPGGRSARA
jgi:membrane fusion protein, multidrug efflux system